MLNSANEIPFEDNRNTGPSGLGGCQCAVDYDNWGHVQPQPVLTKACQARIAAGWRLVGFSGGAFVWVR